MSSKIPFSKLKTEINKMDFSLVFNTPTSRNPNIIENSSTNRRDDVVTVIKHWFKLNGDTVVKGVGLDKCICEDELNFYIYTFMPELNKYIFQIIRKDKSKIKCFENDIEIKVIK